MIEKATEKHIAEIIKIYNNITGRNRTYDQHNWEWFKSPDKNNSYVIVNENRGVLGHHGILTVKLYKNGEVLKLGKTENTIIKKGFGALYFKHEKQMFKEYVKDYDILISTAVNGVTERIREKLGYKPFSKYVVRVRVVNIIGIQRFIKSSTLRSLLRAVSPFLNFLIRNQSIDNSFSQIQIQAINIKHLESFENLYEKVKGKIGISQVRTLAYLKHRFLENPYKETYIFQLKVKDTNELAGAILFYIHKDTAYIEDLLFLGDDVFRNLISAFFNSLKQQKLAHLIFIRLLDGSMLSNKTWNGYLAKKQKKDTFCVNLLAEKTNFSLDKFYFTPLLNEGII